MTTVASDVTEGSLEVTTYSVDAYIVVRATSQAYGGWQNRGYQNSETTEPNVTKFGMGNYVGGGFPANLTDQISASAYIVLDIHEFSISVTVSTLHYAYVWIVLLLKFTIIRCCKCTFCAPFMRALHQVKYRNVS